jgi:RNA-directed DNA polymerase
VQAGLLSREMGESGAPTLLELAEGNTGHGAIREPWSGPARSKTLGMYGISMRENREIPWPPVRLITGRAAQGRPRPHA